MKATNWLTRDIAMPGPYLCLCLSEQEYLAAVRRLKVTYPPPWLGEHGNAAAHSFTNTKAGLAVVVCVGPREGRTGIEEAGLLVHEAVHVWQSYTDYMGERAPAAEQEAYAIQAIAQELMTEYARRTV